MSARNGELYRKQELLHKYVPSTRPPQSKAPEYLLRYEYRLQDDVINVATGTCPSETFQVKASSISSQRHRIRYVAGTIPIHCAHSPAKRLKLRSRGCFSRVNCHMFQFTPPPPPQARLVSHSYSPKPLIRIAWHNATNSTCKHHRQNTNRSDILLFPATSSCSPYTYLHPAL